MTRTPLSVNGKGQVSTVDSLFASANWKRTALEICSPPGQPDEGVNAGSQVSGASTATTGVKLSYTVPAGQQGQLVNATAFSTAVAGVVTALQVVRGATTYNLGSVTTSGLLTPAFPLQPGDVVQWNVTTLQAASTTDYTISVILDKQYFRIAIGFGQPAVIDQTLTLNVGTLPVKLTLEDYGEIIQRDIHIITSGQSFTLSYVDTMEL